MTTKLLDKTKNTFQDLLTFGYSNLSKSFSEAKKWDEQCSQIHVKKMNLLRSFGTAETTLLGDRYFLEDNAISVLINQLTEYKQAKDGLEKLRKDGSDYNLTNITGVERSLTGEFYEQILELNKYVYTTSSTNNPEDPSFQEMFVGFYVPKSVALKLAKFLDAKGEFNYYSCYENNDNKIIVENKKNTKDFTDNMMHSRKRDGTIAINTEFPQVLEDMGMFNHLFSTEDPLVYMNIEDQVIDHRDLYSVLLDFFLL
jgi:hypothetical protein